MFGPLRKAVQVKSVPAHSVASSRGVTLNNLHVAYYANILVIVLVLLLNYYILPGDLLFDVLEEVLYFIGVDSAVGDDVSKLLIHVFDQEKEGVL